MMEVTSRKCSGKIKLTSRAELNIMQCLILLGMRKIKKTVLFRMEGQMKINILYYTKSVLIQICHLTKVCA